MVYHRDNGLGKLNTFKFPIRHPWDRYAFPGFVTIIWFVILMGFVPDVIHKFRKQGFNYPLAVHIHAAVYVSWLVLLTVQTVLIGRGRVALHKRLGVWERLGPGANRDDLYDAFAALWTAHRISRGAAVEMPTDPEYDAAGLPMRIVS
jgi:uncharacterized protein DUF429